MEGNKRRGERVDPLQEEESGSAKLDPVLVSDDNDEWWWW
jgi:hypothetical protein